MEDFVSDYSTYLPTYTIDNPYELSISERSIMTLKDQIFSTITSGFPSTVGKEISKKERDTRINLPADSTLTYGEINFNSFFEIFETIRTRYNLLPDGGVFYDLGSGLGKAVIAASLLHNFSECKGIEILEGLFSASGQLKSEYDAVFPEEVVKNPEIWISPPKVSFIHADFFDYDWRDGTFIFVNSTCFTSQMMEKIALVQATKGTVGVSFSKPIPRWKILERISKPMGWGDVSVYIQVYQN